MRIIIVTMGSLGDVRPYIPLAAVLKKNEKYQVAIVSTDNHRELITSFDIEFIGIKEYFRQTRRLPRWRIFMVINSALEIRDGFLDDLWNACKEADFIIYNSFTFPAYYIAEKLKIKSIGLFLQPNHPSVYFPHPFLTNGKPLGKLFNRIQFSIFDGFYWLRIRTFINRWRANTLQLPKIPVWKNLSAQIRSSNPSILYAWSPAFFPKPPDWKDLNIEISGYWYHDTTQKTTISPELEDFLKAGPPPVYISMRWNAEKFNNGRLYEISSKLNERIIVHDYYEQLDGVSSNEKLLYLTGDVPLEWLFTKVAAAVHHGGVGILMECIRTTTPMVTIASDDVNDHRFWIYLAEKNGVCFNLNVSHKDTSFVNKLVEAIKKVKVDEKLKHRLTEMGNKIRQERGLQRAVEFINAATHVESISSSFIK
jgi:sterol 3beta-glucosyltransferase